MYDDKVSYELRGAKLEANERGIRRRRRRKKGERSESFIVHSGTATAASKVYEKEKKKNKGLAREEFLVQGKTVQRIYL